MVTIAQSPATGVVSLQAGELEAAVVPATGMVVASLRHRGEELLAQRDGVAAYARCGATMGVPFLHPWANRLDGWPYDAPDVPREEHGLQIHGVLPRAWLVQERGPDAVTAALRFSSPAFPFEHDVRQDVWLSPRALTITTTVRAAGEAPVPIAFGFHPYLVLPGVARPDWQLELPARRHLPTDARGIPSGAATWEAAQRAPLGARTFDDGYDGLGASPRFAISGGGRTIAVTFLRGYPVAQVFAPDALDVVCFEPMTAPVNALVSGDGLRTVSGAERFSAAFEIRVCG
jgi:galactose mutarotase-like enzyme